MSRIVLPIVTLVAGLAGAPLPSLAQNASGFDNSGDPIAAAIQETGRQATPSLAKTRVFSPQAISDLLKEEAGKADAPGGDTPKTVRSTPARSTAVPRAIDVPAIASRNTPDAAMANARAPLTPEAINAVRFSRLNETSKSIDPVVLKAEILLDRAHAPPGVIDGRYGSNFTKAISTFETLRGLPIDGKLTRRVWDELGADNAAPVLVSYTIKPEDIVGPFYPDLSPDYAEQAKMPDLGYRSAEEMFGERFHMDRKFLKALNPGVDMTVAGSTILVADIETLPIAAQIGRIDVDKAKGQVLAYDPSGTLVVAYPATIGSDELPSPSGSWVVRGIAPHPTYTYDPVKNFQQGTNTKKLILPPGPNNPVGASFIALSKPTYGIHGTPDPSKIDKTRSHGCVRLTNWNAQELARLVKVGVPVNFLDRPGAEPPPEREPDIASVIESGAGYR